MSNSNTTGPCMPWCAGGCGTATRQARAYPGVRVGVEQQHDRPLHALVCELEWNSNTTGPCMPWCAIGSGTATRQALACPGVRAGVEQQHDRPLHALVCGRVSLPAICSCLATNKSLDKLVGSVCSSGLSAVTSVV